MVTIHSFEYFFPNVEPICYSMPGSNSCLLTCIQISHEAEKVVCYFHLFRIFQFAVIHIVKGFSVASEAEVDAFSGILLLFRCSSGSWQFDLWFLCHS